MKRRDLLKSMGAVAGAAGLSKFLPGCGDGGGGVGSPDAGEEGPPGIKNVVLLMFENRSYDHWLGARSMLEGKGGDGLVATMSNRDRDDNEVKIWEASGSLCVPDPPHGWERSHEQWGSGANAGFLTTHQLGAPGDLAPMQYMTRDQLPVTWALADAYATCDRWFASVMGPTWPNRMFWLAGTSMGMQGNELPPEDFTADTIFHRLDEKGVPWKLYYGDLPFLFLLGHGFDVDPVGRVLPLDDFYTDCANGTLPPVTYLDPPFGYADDHPPHHPILGQQFLASVYTALANSPQWKNTLLIVTYDEHGGFFDHVPPPRCKHPTPLRPKWGWARLTRRIVAWFVENRYSPFDFRHLGVRVPTIVMSPWIAPRSIDDRVYDHSSIVATLRLLFAPDEEALTARDRAAESFHRLVLGTDTPRDLPETPAPAPPPPDLPPTAPVPAAEPTTSTATQADTLAEQLGALEVQLQELTALGLAERGEPVAPAEIDALARFERFTRDERERVQGTGGEELLAT
jgi:phospholipase C